MKINDKKGTLANLSKTGSASATKSTAKASGGQSTTGSVRKSGVSVSSDAQIASTLAGEAARRAERVSSIKMDVEAGNYKPDALLTAEKILQSLTDYSLA